MKSNNRDCQHSVLQLDPSPFAAPAGYTQPTMHKLATAIRLSSRSNKTTESEQSRAYPSPLVLPHDELNYDPDYPPQSVYGWLHTKSRNKMNSDRNRDILYICRVPKIAKTVEFMRDWTAPVIDTAAPKELATAKSPDATLYANYLGAFYHGMTVKVLDENFTWTNWEKTSRPSSRVSLPKYVGLTHDGVCTRIRVRKAPDGSFSAQLNLNDIIDALIQALPTDAYAVVLLVDHDIYENDEDDFCCGRAYGSSRVAVVQTARYNPLLDQRENIDHTHMWPLSHCKDFVDELCAVEDVKPRPPTKQQIAASNAGPLRAAINAATLNSDLNVEQEHMAMWFSRLARTVSHELGHCFGIDHCVYYACNMQGSASLKEDMRQPPYFCPVCETKVCHAIVGELQNHEKEQKNEWKWGRLQELRSFCATMRAVKLDTMMWRGMEAWLEAQMEGVALI